MSQYVYHFKPKGMTGDRLIPLNALKAAMPETYSEQAKKYKGREAMMEKTIPILECLWNDVLHFSPINPQIILDTWRKDEALMEFAAPKLPIEVYKVPVKLLKESTVCFQSFNYDFNNFSADQEKYWKFDSATYQEQQAVDPKQLEIWIQDKKAGRFLLWYSHTMHVLARQEIRIGECELIVCK